MSNVDWAGAFLNWFPMLLLIGVWVYFMRKAGGGGGYYARQDKLLDEYTRHNELLAKVIERMDARIARLEDQQPGRGPDK